MLNNHVVLIYQKSIWPLIFERVHVPILQNSRKFVLAENVSLENSVIFRQFWGFLQHFDGESAKIYAREIRSFLSARKLIR